LKRILQLIDRGEGDMLDFKKEISSVHRIARSIVAFANHYGGTLLVGVNDDGSISGVRAEEEKFMLEKSAAECCHPPVILSIHEWNVNGKVVLEVIVPESHNKPVYALDEEGKRWVVVRSGDQSLLASKPMVEVLRHKHSSRPVLIQYSDIEKSLLDYLKTHPRITLKEFCKLVNIGKFRGQRILVKLTAVGVLRLHDQEKTIYYTLLD
jgi:hypothetical protein